MVGPLTVYLTKSTVSVLLTKRYRSHDLSERKFMGSSSFSYDHMRTEPMVSSPILFF